MTIRKIKLAVILSTMDHIVMVELLSCHHDIINHEGREVRKINIVRKTTHWVVFLLSIEIDIPYHSPYQKIYILKEGKSNKFLYLGRSCQLSSY